MQFRFTLYNSVAGSRVINEPDGWKDIKIKLVRDKDYHSLIEMIDTSFFYYNSGNSIDGGREFISGIESTQGINAIVRLTIELTEDDNSYDTVFIGNLDLSTVKDISKDNKFYRYQCNIIPSDLWSTFLNRRSTPIDLKSTTDLDGNAVAAPTSGNLQLSSQAVRKNADYEQYDGIDPLYSKWGWDYTATNLFFPIDLPSIIQNEIATKLNYPSGQAGPNDPSAYNTPDLQLITCLEAGTYNFTIQIVLSDKSSGSAGSVPIAGSWLVKFEINKGTPTSLTAVTHGTNGVDARTVYTYTGSQTLLVGDQIKLYFQSTLTGLVGTETVYVIGNGAYEDSYIRISADTLYTDSVAEYLLVHDAGNSLIKRMTASQFSLYSDYFGGTTQGYGANGCGYLNGILKGLHVRGYTLTEKPFSMAFDDWWGGLNPMFNLGLGPELVAGVERLRVEQKDHFYDDNPILYFDFVDGIERSYDQSMILKSVQIGYTQWSAESASGIDDPQTTHTYSTVYKIVGTDSIIKSGFVAASLAIEQTRRNRKTTNQDWRMDDNIMIIALSDTTTPEVNVHFTGIFDLLNSTTRYNIRHTPNRLLKRWNKFLSASLQTYLSSKFKFTYGEGNYTFSVGTNTDTCDTGTWAEGEDVSPSSSPYCTAQTYMCIVDLSWTDYKLLRDNRHRAIAISNTGADHKICHIDTLEYAIATAKATITAWIK